MALPDLHLFVNDLRNTPLPGSSAPPRTIRATNLDENFQKVTVLASEEDPPAYQVTYTRDGTLLSNFRTVPDGTTIGDLLYWSGERWAVLPSVGSSTLHVLTIQNRALAWTPTQDCP